MNDVTRVSAGHTKKYNIPFDHLEHRYIQHCTDGTELERIYKELLNGERGKFPMLEQLTLERIRNIQPHSQILRQDRIPLGRSAIPNNELYPTHETSVSSTTNDHENNGIDLIPSPSNGITSNSTLPVSSAPVINNKHKRTAPDSAEQWEKFEQKVSREFNSDNENDGNSDDDEKSSSKSNSSDQIYENSQHLHMAKQHRLNGTRTFKSNNYQQSIDFYIKSIMLDNDNPIAYINRAIAYYKLDNFDASIQDCSQILSINPNHVKALFCRASCFLAKQQYDEAKHDLEAILNNDPDNNEAQNLFNTITTVQNTNTGDNDTLSTTPMKIPNLDIEDEEEQPVNNELIHPMSIDIPQRQIIDSDPYTDYQNASPPMFDRDNINQFQLSPLDGEVDDNDDMILGDEAGTSLVNNLSDEDEYVSRGLNVSPTIDDDFDAPELVGHKPLQTPPLTPPTKQFIKDNSIDQTIASTFDGNKKQTQFSAISHHQTNDDDDNDLYDNNHNIPTISYMPNIERKGIKFMPYQSSIPNTTKDVISNSNFCSTIQNWLRDLITLQSSGNSSSYNERILSKSGRPWALDKLQRDIERFSRFDDFRNTIEASKKMLKNGTLDYHHHAEYIVNTLVLCAECYSKLNDPLHAIQYATEALQYNRIDSNALICRAKAFENEKFLLFSYADYARVPSNHFSYDLTPRVLEKLTIQLNSIEGETWREQLPQDKNDDERYLTVLKIKDQYSENDQYEWYQKHADQLYLDACFVLAIRFYTNCIELKPDITLTYFKRAACYLKVFESQKAIDDCDMVLKEDSNHFHALYRKACAYKMARDYRLYELTLKEYIKLQPNNQIVLAEYYTCRHEQIPRKKRRIRIHPISSEIESMDIIEENNLSYEELEQIRLEKTVDTQTLDSLNTNNIKEQCSFVLRLPEDNLYTFVRSATTKLIEILINASRTMIHAEHCYQEEHQSSILPFSYIKFCYNILIELATLPQMERSLSMIDQHYRALFNELLSYYSSISSISYEIEKLNQLKKM